MNAEEIGQLLAVCASFDARKVEEPDIIAWGEILGGEVDFVTARKRVLEYYRNNRERIMPSDILNPLTSEGIPEHMLRR